MVSPRAKLSINDLVLLDESKVCRFIFRKGAWIGIEVLSDGAQIIVTRSRLRKLGGCIKFSHGRRKVFGLTETVLN